MRCSLRVRGGALIAIVLVGCQAQAVSGAPCTRTSECTEPLVCASSVCREQCADARDCGGGASCVTYRSAGVCVPPSTPVPCVFDADCGALFCRSGHCVAQCTTDHDCDDVSGAGTCVVGDASSGMCARPRETPPAPADAGVDTGVLRCAPSEVACVDAVSGTTVCTDLMTDHDRCGACGHSCAGATCVAGVCTCLPPHTQCGTACVDLGSDVGNCGSCSNTCLTAMGTAVCSTGHCCSTGQIWCGACVDGNSDGNCGGCGVTCMPGWSCRQSACRPPGDTCGDAMTVTVADGAMPLTTSRTDTLGNPYLVDGPCGGNDFFARLVASTPTIAFVDGQGTRWSEGRDCASAFTCALGPCSGYGGAEFLGLVGTTPRLFDVGPGSGSGYPFVDPSIFGVPIGALASTRLDASESPWTIVGPFGPPTALSDIAACGATSIAVGYWETCGPYLARTVHACDATGARASLALRVGAGAVRCGVPDPSCPGGAMVSIADPSSTLLLNGFVVAFVGHASASDTGPVTLTMTTP